MADIQSAAAEIRRGKTRRRRKNKPQHENIMVCPIPYGDHKKTSVMLGVAYNVAGALLHGSSARANCPA